MYSGFLPDVWMMDDVHGSRVPPQSPSQEAHTYKTMSSHSSALVIFVFLLDSSLDNDALFLCSQHHRRYIDHMIRMQRMGEHVRMDCCGDASERDLLYCVTHKSIV